MELNREQIVKALECCSGIKKLDACANCPAHLGCNDCVDFLREEALALIRELTEENERLRVVADMSDTTLTDALRIVNEFCDSRIKRAIADTVRKMQERLHDDFRDIPTRSFIHDVIDQIAKELLEEG